MKTPLLAALALALVVAPAGLAAAHSSQSSADGKIKITWGWLDEPAYTDSKNRLDLVIRDAATNQGIGGLTAANFTEVSLHSPVGDEEYDLGAVSAYAGAKGASAGPGNYTSAKPVIPTAPGVYVLHIVGNVQGSAFDLEIPASHAVDDSTALAFPARNASGLDARVAALEQEVAALKAQSKTSSETPATVTPQTSPAAKGIPAPAALGALGIVGVVAFLLGRRR